MKWIIVSAIIVCLIGVSFIYLKRSRDNVCKTFADYYSNRDNNDNCYYNPDYNLTVPQIIQRHGYPQETHTVITKDGYRLTVFRIPHGKKPTNKKPTKTVFLQHGLGTSSVCFVIMGQKSLAFILADEGYDVWLGNFRGTSYSQNHTYLNNSDSKFWDFSFHEHGFYDLPAQLDLVSSLTKEKITYIGYSMGSTAMYVYQATYPDISFERVNMFINLAPAVFLNNSKTILKYAFPLWYLIEPVLKALNNGRIHGKRLTSIPQWVIDYMCFPFPFQMKLCYLIDNIIFGFNYEQNDPETFPVVLKNIPDYTSVKSLTHFVQLSQSEHFKNYDYGIEINKNLYGSYKPPFYDLSKMRIPSHFIRGENDLMITKENVEELYNTLPKEIRPYEIYVVKNENFNHYDFVTAKDVVPLLYDHIVNFLKSHRTQVNAKDK